MVKVLSSNHITVLSPKMTQSLRYDQTTLDSLSRPEPSETVYPEQHWKMPAIVTDTGGESDQSYVTRTILSETREIAIIGPTRRSSFLQQCGLKPVSDAVAGFIWRIRTDSKPVSPFTDSPSRSASTTGSSTPTHTYASTSGSSTPTSSGSPSFAGHLNSHGDVLSWIKEPGRA